MTTSDYPNPVLLIRAKTGRIIGACSAACYDDEGFHCTCICGGDNHGVGRKQAAQNVVDGIEIDWRATWAKIPRSECQVIVPRGVRRFAEQSELFDRNPRNQQESEPCRPPKHLF